MWDDTLSDTAASLTLDVVNNAPEVSFDMEGKNPNPDLAPKVTISPAKMLADWKLYETTSSNSIPNRNKLWTVKTGALTAGSGATFHAQVQYFNTTKDWNTGDYQDIAHYADNGYGANSMSPWRAMTSLTKTGDLGIPGITFGQGWDADASFPDYDTHYWYENPVPVIKANKKYAFIHANSEVWALNKNKIDQANPYDWHIGSKNGNRKVLWFDISDRTLYAVIKNNGTSYTLESYDIVTGAKIASIPTYAYMNKVTKNDNIVILHEDNQKFYEYDRDLNNVRQVSAPSLGPYPCMGGGPVWYSPLYAGEEGEFYLTENYQYGYSQNGCPANPDDYIKFNVYRINADLTVGWKTEILGYPTRNYGDNYSATQKISPITLDPIRHEVTVRAVEKAKRYTLSTKTGAIKSSAALVNDLGYFLFDQGSYGWNGIDNSKRLALFHPDLYTTYFKTEGYYSGNDQVLDPSGSVVTTIPSRLSSADSPGLTLIQGYFGDGIYLQAKYNDSWMFTPREYIGLAYAKGTPTTNQLNGPIQPYQLGQFVSTDEQDNMEYSFSLRMPYTDEDQELAGFSFRMTNPAYRYAVETDGAKLFLSKYSSGVRTILASQVYSFQPDTSYSFNIKAINDSLKVSMNGVPFFDLTDSTYTRGFYGYFADKAYICFSALTTKPLANNVAWSNQYAIWDSGPAKAEIKYNNIRFEDPENDPAVGGVYDWTVNHTVRFIHNQGLSALNGQTFHEAQLSFDKVGDYTVKLKAKDDPNPGYLAPANTFDEYRKSSNAFIKKITVHRRPIADFSVVQGSDAKVQWTDRSHDPDRYMSAADTQQKQRESTIKQQKVYWKRNSSTLRQAGIILPRSWLLRKKQEHMKSDLQ